MRHESTGRTWRQCQGQLHFRGGSELVREKHTDGDLLPLSLPKVFVRRFFPSSVLCPPPFPSLLDVPGGQVSGYLTKKFRLLVSERSIALK